MAGDPAVAVTVYYDFASPFCYAARAVVDRLRARFPLRVRWAPFEVIDYLPPAGAMPQNPAFVRRGEAERVHRLAAEYGLELHLRERLLNSNLALCAVAHAEAIEADSGATALADAVHAALFDAFYRDRRDIGDRAVVVEVANAAGLDGGIEPALADGRYRAEVARSKADAIELGVTSVPLFLAGGYAIAGVPALGAFEDLIARAMGAAARP